MPEFFINLRDLPRPYLDKTDEGWTISLNVKSDFSYSFYVLIHHHNGSEARPYTVYAMDMGDRREVIDDEEMIRRVEDILEHEDVERQDALDYVCEHCLVLAKKHYQWFWGRVEDAARRWNAVLYLFNAG